jgi:hypothetical protein
MTWEQAAFKSASEIWAKHNTYKNFTIKPFLDFSVPEIENLRDIIDHYIKTDLYLQKIKSSIDNIDKEDFTHRKVEHRFLWCAMSVNAINAINKLYPESKIKMLDVLLTVIRKQKDYGHHNIAMFGITGLVIRIHDKIARAENLLTKQNMENAVPGESLYDTFLDIIGYSIIALMWLDNTFMLKLEES